MPDGAMGVAVRGTLWLATERAVHFSGGRGRLIERAGVSRFLRTRAAARFA
jgi:hypothetical protein